MEIIKGEQAMIFWTVTFCVVSVALGVGAILGASGFFCGPDPDEANHTPPVMLTTAAQLQLTEQELDVALTLLARRKSQVLDLCAVGEAAAQIIREYRAELGRCDHEVNVCHCGISSTLQVLEQTVANARGKCSPFISLARH